MTLGNGQVWSNALDQDGRVVNYYDNIDRVTSFATTGRSQSFGYDATGNLLTKSDLVGTTQTNYTYTIAPTSNRMTGIASMGIGYSFDAAGNRTGDGRITYDYNYRGRLHQVRIINGAITDTYNYLINGVNLRVRKTGPSTVVPSGTRIFVYDDAARLIGEYDNLGRAAIEHVWLDERPIAAITYTYSGTSTTPLTTTTSYVETDHLATPRLITNASRQKRWSWESAPYGDTFANENPQALGVYTYNLRFPGQYFDKETNHHYNHHRDYESTTGRYVQSDPIGLTGGINTYYYVFNNPIRYVDALGLDVLVCFYTNAAGGAGHVGFGPPAGPTSGFYAADGESFRGGRGEIHEDRQPPGRFDACKVIPAKSEQDQCMETCQAQRAANPGTYHVTDRNCTHHLRDCLKKCGLPNGSYGGPAPERFFLFLPGNQQPRPGNPQSKPE